MSQVAFTLTYDGPALREHEMNVRDLAPAMLAVGETFEALNALYNGRTAKVAVNVRAHEPGCFKVVFDVMQVIHDSTGFLAGTEVTGALNLMAILFGGTGVGLIGLVKLLQGKKPEKVEQLEPGLYRLTLGDQAYEVPIELLAAYKELRVRRAIEGFVAKPLDRPGIDEMQIERGGQTIEHVAKDERDAFRAPPPDDDVLVDDTRRMALAIRDLSFDEDRTWNLMDGPHPIKAKIEDRAFLDSVDANETRFAKHDVLVCDVHFVQRRAVKGGIVNDYTVVAVIEHISAPKQLRFPDPS
jgi:hypothetical protein